MWSLSRRIRWTALTAFAAGALAACSDGSRSSSGTDLLTPAAPIVPASVTVVVGSATMVLQARVSFTAAGADSVRVAYQAPNGPVQFTPFHAVGQNGDTILVLGLRPKSRYTYHVEAMTGGVSASSTDAAFTTAQVPGQLDNVQIQQISGAQHHYVATGVLTGDGGYAVIFDSTGTIVWYHDFTATKLTVSNVVMQPNGNITAFLGNTSGWQPLEGYYVEMNPAGDIVNTYRPPAGSFMDDHEFLITGSGASQTVQYFTFTTRQLDLSALGLSPNTTTAGHQIRRFNASGAEEFTWDAWDHISIDEWVGDTTAKTTRGNSTDFDHPNAMTFDTAGNYVVSWRNLDQIMAIDPNNGNVLWRLGGTKSDFTFVNDPLNGFYKQHSVKVLANGDILLFDNGAGHVPAQSRAVEYRLDMTAKTATMVWESRHNPPLFAVFVGWVDRFMNGNTWVAYSYFGRAVEVDASSNVVWEGQLVVNGANPTAYRMVPIVSLYRYVKT
ncbi:MAG TPA: aryl-sulfate sulfotransferase [Gemmatimonadaceae bacterium]|nr:aryl-sulfate sulfotransferase [Gemmatimonadaceae bacterium]